MTKTIYFEQPTNEHIRVCLRLEFLFQKIQFHSEGENPWNSRIILESLLETVNIIDRPDLKNTFVKELTRQHANLFSLNNLPQVDTSKLKSVLSETTELIEALNILPNKLVSVLRDNDFLNSIRHHLANPAGACDFDNPGLHCWLEQPYSVRKRYLTYWLSEIETIKRAVNLIMRLIRESSESEYKTATQGFFQISLDPKTPCQLVSVGLAIESRVHPEISLGPHRICIRFLKSNFQGRPQQSNDEIIFKLKCCVI